MGTGSRALMGWVGSQSLGIYVEESLGYCSSFESQIHEHVGVEGQNLGIFCCATSGITGAPRIQGREGCQQLNQDYNGLESNNNQKHWGPGVCFRHIIFRTSMEVFIVQLCVPPKCCWNSGHLESGCLLGFQFQEEIFLPRCFRVSVSLLGWVTPFPSAAALGAPGNGSIWHFPGVGELSLAGCSAGRVPGAGLTQGFPCVP